MILTFPTKKDTFVTNLNSIRAEGITSNFGAASTLDLFKTYNENKHSYSRAFISFDTTQTINNNSVISFKDSLDTNIDLIFDNTLLYENSTYDINQSVYTLGIQDKLPEEYTEIISEALNQSTVKIKAYYTSDEIVLQQENKGDKGDTEFNIDDISNVAASKVLKINNKDFFSRIDWSFILIKFDLADLLAHWADAGLQGAFTSGEFNAKLILKDVSTGIAKPRNYSVVCHKLKKNFLEGIGKDTIELSDSYKANFVNLSDTESWEIPGYISKGTDVEKNVISSFNVTNGDEDIVLDVTSYIEEIITSGEESDHGLLVCLSDDTLFNKKSYFAKRLGSKHLLKKSLIPSLNICINDSKYHIGSYDIDKKQYNINNSNLDFYFANNKNNLRSNIIYPTGYDQISHELTEADGTVIIEKSAASDFYDFKGRMQLGIKHHSIDVLTSNIILPNYFEKAALNNGIIKAKSRWYYTDSNDLLESIFIKENAIDLMYHNVESKTNLENLYVTINFDKELTANNTDYIMTTYFIDLKEKFNASKSKYNLLSKDLGDVFYRVRDKNTGNIIIDVNDSTQQNATALKYNGENYEAKIFIPEHFKNYLLEFEFVYKDLTGNLKNIKNNKISHKVLQQ